MLPGMKPLVRTFALAAAVAASASAQDGTFEKPFKVDAGGKPIDVTTGHAAPLVRDWDGDGKADLLVGEFGADKFAKLRVYKNVGEQNRPAFKDFVFAQAGGADATIPSG
jgi:hypothetical protein